jgi:hypothetical protein
MIGRLAIVALAVGLASCAGLEPAGRNARNNGPAPTASAPPAPTPAPQQQRAALPPPQTTPAPQQPVQRAPLAVPPAPQQQQAAPVATTPAPQRVQPSAPPVAAPQVTVPAAPPVQEAAAPARARSPDEDIVVPGQVETQVRPPVGDPRTNEERRADVRAWDQCLTQVQSAFDSDPMRPQMTTPEEYCSQSLGMSGRTSVPIARQNRRR